MNSLVMTVAPESSHTRLLMLNGQTEVMKAVLGPASLSHPRAAATSLEAGTTTKRAPSLTTA